jgi:AcrR family transcriptional regulator
MAELGESGYAEVTLDRIARRAGVHKTTLYRRWGTREALALEAMLEHAGRRVPIPDTGSLREDLLTLATAAAGAAATPQGEARHLQQALLGRAAGDGR